MTHKQATASTAIVSAENQWECRRWMFRVCCALTMLGAMLSVAVSHAGEVRKPDGRMSLSINATMPPGGGFKGTLNTGTLTLTDGTTQLFTVRGIGIEGEAGSPVDFEAKGEVYNLPRLADFAGTYRRIIGEISPGRDTNTLIIENEHRVRVVVTVTVDRASGNIRLVPSESGVKVSLER